MELQDSVTAKPGGKGEAAAAEIGRRMGEAMGEAAGRTAADLAEEVVAAARAEAAEQVDEIKDQSVAALQRGLLQVARLFRRHPLVAVMSIAVAGVLFGRAARAH